ncbi:hypothetical protein [uncultured Shewanella sp.]|uniref:outer membrane protein n=1 Tax=uncultured Shewanella sp. TaxID=173975 RepID=UPI002603B915|nr:hypothetical protein [uncultured Shewanella sp.]
MRLELSLFTGSENMHFQVVWVYTLAAGLNTSLNHHLALRFGYEYAEADIKSGYGSKLKTKMSQFSLGLNYTF